MRRALRRALRRMTAALLRTEMVCGIAHTRYLRRASYTDRIVWCPVCAKERTEFGHDVSGW